MNVREDFSTVNPFGGTSECSKFTIDDITNPFILRNIMVPHQHYTLSFYAKADTESVLTIQGTTLTISPAWERYILLFTSEGVNLNFVFGTGVFYIYKPKLELGNKATDWTPAPEDLATGDELDDVQDDLDNTKLDLKYAHTLIEKNASDILLRASLEEFNDLTKRVSDAELKLTPDGIVSIVGTTYAKTDDVNKAFENVSTVIEQTDQNLTVKINDAAKTATNFLKYDGGLIVGEIPQTETGELGNNVLITTTGVNIRNGDAVLAKFEKDSIRLGLDSNLSTINLLNGAAVLSATTNIAGHTEFVLDGADYILLRSLEKTSGWTAASRVYMTSESVRLLTSVEYSDGTMSNASLYLEGSSVTLGYGVSLESDSSGFCINSNGGALFTDLVVIQKNGVSTIIGSYNNGWSHFQTGGSIPFYFDSPLHAVDKIQVYGSTTFLYHNGLAVGDTTYNDGFIELYGGTPFIDFHFNDADVDYTSRIIETASGELRCEGAWTVTGNIISNGYLRIAQNVVCLDSGHGLYGTHTDGSTRMRVAVASTSNAGTSTDAVNCTIHGDGNYRTYLVGASIYHNKALNQYSDKRLKTDIEKVDKRYTEFFDKLSPVLYHMKTNISGGKDIGYIAQDVLEAMEMSGISEKENTIVNRTGNPDDESLGEILTLNYNGLFVVSSYALQDARQRIEKLEEEIRQLKRMWAS